MTNSQWSKGAPAMAVAIQRPVVFLAEVIDIAPIAPRPPKVSIKLKAIPIGQHIRGLILSQFHGTK